MEDSVREKKEKKKRTSASSTYGPSETWLATSLRHIAHRWGTGGFLNNLASVGMGGASDHANRLPTWKEEKEGGSPGRDGRKWE